MREAIIRLRSVLIALIALALSASLVFGAQPTSSRSAGHHGFVAQAGDEDGAGDEDSDEDSDEDEDADEDSDEDSDADEDSDEEGAQDEDSDEEADSDDEGLEDEGDGENCLVDPTTVTPEELATMNHGSIVCWAAHQETWPGEFKNHGAWVSSWAHASQDEAKAAARAARDAAKATAKATRDAAKAAKGQGKGHNK